MAMNKAERVQSTRKNARRQGSFRGGLNNSMADSSRPNQTNQKCPIGQELITGPDGKKRCGTPKPRMPKAGNRGY